MRTSATAFCMGGSARSRGSLIAFVICWPFGRLRRLADAADALIRETQAP